MSDSVIPSDEALAILMSIEDMGFRRDFIAADLVAGRRFASIDRLVLALALKAPFGLDDDWMRLSRTNLPSPLNNKEALHYLQNNENAWRMLDVFEHRMPKRRFEQLQLYIDMMNDEEEPDSSFELTFAELKLVNAQMALEFGHEIRGEVFWSRDTIISPSGTRLPFTFSMLNRKQLLGCVAGPYDDEDPEPSDFGLQILDDRL